MMLCRTSLIRLLHLGSAFKLVVHVKSIVARDSDEGLLLGLREPTATFDDDAAARENMFVNGTTRTFRNVRYLVAVGCKADIEQAASKVLDL
jgi:hypothetical protein